MTQRDLVLCLDSGTTRVKAAAFTLDGELVGLCETPNAALRRNGARVEQDMAVSRADAFAMLRRCAAEHAGTVHGIIVTGQGDGLWPLDADGRPVGSAITWLDGRTRQLQARLSASGATDRVQAITSARPTAASQILHLLWLQDNEPERFGRIRHALRLKEYLFHTLSGALVCEPTTMLSNWGRWQDGRLSEEVERTIGLKRGIALLPPLTALADCRATLSEAAARDLGIAAGTPVLLGPGDVQSTAIGLGLGVSPTIAQASTFGTSAIHIGYVRDPDAIQGRPSGAIIQPFALGSGYLCLLPCFNGTTAFGHLDRLLSRAPADTVTPAYSQVIVHPFLEPGGERAPYTDPDAKGALIGLGAAATPDEVAWAAREALAFLARTSHDIMDPAGGAVAVGGGLAGDSAFMAFLADTLGRPIYHSTSPHVGLQGLGLIAAHHLGVGDGAALAARWLDIDRQARHPRTGPLRDYAERKYRVFTELVERVSPLWQDMSALAEQARAFEAAGGS